MVDWEQDIADRMTERLLDSALSGLENFMVEYTGWFALLCFAIIISMLGTITSIFNIMDKHATMVILTLKNLFKSK